MLRIISRRSHRTLPDRLLASSSPSSRSIPSLLHRTPTLAPSPRVRRYTSFTTTPSTTTTAKKRMASSQHNPDSVEDIVSRLNALGISHPPVLSHEPTTSPQAWRDILSSSSSSSQSTPSAATVPESYSLIKTLIFKPKTGKDETVVPVVVVAHEGTETNSTALGKKLGLKDLRLANEGLLEEFFGVGKDAGELKCFSPLLSFSCCAYMLVDNLVFSTRLELYHELISISILNNTILSSLPTFHNIQLIPPTHHRCRFNTEHHTRPIPPRRSSILLFLHCLPQRL